MKKDQATSDQMTLPLVNLPYFHIFLILGISATHLQITIKQKIRQITIRVVTYK
jgi:hypothetical protein